MPGRHALWKKNTPYVSPPAVGDDGVCTDARQRKHMRPALSNGETLRWGPSFDIGPAQCRDFSNAATTTYSEHIEI